MNLITEQEVYNTAFNRNLELGLIKPSQIKVSQNVWVGNYFLGTLYNKIINNPTDYSFFIEEYLKPIISWGVVYNNFEYIATQITDKGIVQMLVENTANLVGRDARFDAKLEIKRTIIELIKIAQMYAENEREEGNELFENFVSIDMNKFETIKFKSNTKSFNLKPY